MFDRLHPAEQLDLNGGPRNLTAAALALLALAALAAALIDPTVLCALPALVLALLMALRPYPGELVLGVLRRSGGRARRRPAADLPRRVRYAPVPPRGGLLLARALAVRPPPGALLATA